MAPEESLREVPAAAVAAVYSHLAAVEAVLEGMEREKAFEVAGILFYVRLAAGLALGDRRPGDWVEFTQRATHPAGYPPQGPQAAETALEWVRGPKWTAACLAQSAEQLRDLLRDGGGEPPFVRLDVNEAWRAAWLEEMVRRFGTGGAPLPMCASGAHAQAQGRPRRHRIPADSVWLLGQVTGVLETCWTVLSPLRVPYGSESQRMLPELRPRLDGEWGVRANGEGGEGLVTAPA